MATGSSAKRRCAALSLQHGRVWPDARWEEATHFVCDERGVSEWTFRGTDRDGLHIEVRGVDLFVLRDGKIARKDTYRKQRRA